MPFVRLCSEVFATAGMGYIRVWHLATCRELLRIAVPNLECFCVSFATVRVEAGSAPICCCCSAASVPMPVTGRLRQHTPAFCALQDGKSIVSGWSDGKIRAFGPQSGKLLYTIHDAHQKAVTAIACTCVLRPLHCWRVRLMHHTIHSS